MELDDNHNPVSGYAYEYIETMGIYAGWDIEYVPCESFADSLTRLLAGDVDLLYDVSYTEERAKEILFPDEPMGHEYYYLYASKDNTSIFSGDIDSIRGRKVGATSRTMLIDLLKQWCAKKDVELTIVEYDSIPDKEADLLAGKIDLDLEVSMLVNNNLSAIEKIGSSAYYLVANKKRSDLIEDINSATEKVVNNDFSYFDRLQERYFSETVLSRNLTLEEKNWLAEHNVLRVGFFDNYLPFSTLDKNGNPIGACIDAVREIIKKLNLEDDLEVEFVCYRDQRAGYKAVESGEVDIMLPAYISNSVKRDFRIMGGRILASLTSDLGFLKDFGDGRGKRIGVNRNSLMQYYNSRDSYPYSEIVFYDSIQGCLDGILEGTSDATFLNGLRSEALLKPEKYHPIKKAQVRTDYIFYMAFAEDNLGLMLLMDRGMSMLESAFVNKKAYSYIMQMNSLTTMDYLRDHILLVVLFVALFVALVMTVIGVRLNNRKLRGINRELMARSETIEKQRQQESELRKQLEDALQSAQDADREKTGILTDLEDASGVARLASFHYDFNTQIRTGSNLLCELWPTDENGRALLEEEFVYPEDLPVFKQNMTDLFEKKSENVQFSFRVGKDASELRYYRMKLTLDPHKPNAVTGIVQDVTELALNMLKLKDTQALWDAAINAMPFMLTVKDVDNDFRYLLCNNAFADIFHCAPSEITGKTDPELFDNDANLDFASRMNSLALNLEENEMKLFEEDLPTIDGSIRSIKTVMRIIRDTSGRRLLLTASNDISEMVSAKRAAEENADRFLLTLRSIGDGIITTDARGIVTMLNPNAEAMLGCKQADVLGKPHTDFFRIVHQQTGKTVSSPLTEALQSGEVAVGADMTDLISASGQRYHIACNAAPIHARSGEITGAILVFRDVTDERNKREELRRAMISLENASGMARLAAFRYELKTRKRSGSSILYSIWPNDENGNPIRFEEWVYPEDIPLFARELEKMETSHNQGETATFSFRTGQASSLRYIRALITLDLSNPDEPAVAGIMQDVTEMTLSMLKLKDTQAMWDAAINSIPIMFTVKDMDDDFRYLLCNKAFSNVFHFSPDEIVGKTDHDLFHNDTTLGFADQLNTPSTGTDGLMEIEGELPDGDGNLRYIKTLMRVFEDARGHRLLLAAANDVTDMHRLFENQKVVNKLLADIIGEDDFDQSIQRTLETVCKILGASRGCLLRHEEEGSKAHCVYEYVEPTHANASIRMVDHTLPRIHGVMENADDEENRIFVSSDVGSLDWNSIPDEWQRLARDFDIRAFSFSNIVCECEVRGTIGFLFEGVEHTFTENDLSLLHTAAHMIEVVLTRKHAQALIMDALAHAQAADKAKSFFIASVSHEIRTPLNSVIGFAELLREGGVSKEQAQEYLDAISSSANALLMLINDVLDLSKLEANQMKIITAFTDFNALCREVLLIFTFRAQENGNKLVSDVPDDLPELDVDNIRIRQILINLLGNAVKFTKKGSITLHVSFTPDPDSADTGTLRCAVTDTGIGISEEDQKKLMEPFVQLSRIRDTNAVNNGTGLGLSISKRLATCMNGELTCTSRIGEGSTFAITLNAVRYRAKAVKEDKAQSKPEAEAIARDVKTIRILIVDDVPMNLRVAKALFNKIGFDNVFTAGSGRAALEFLGKQPVDLILSDMWMPEMSGAQLSAEIKKNPKFSHIPVVAQTADVETSGNFDMSHFDAIILKPLTKEKLSNMVKRIFEDGDLRKGNGGAPVNLG